MKKLYFAVASLWLLLMIFSINPLVVKAGTAYYQDEYSDYPYIDIVDIEKGDLVFGRAKNPLDFIPGYWTHVAVFIGYENEVPMVIQAEINNFVNKQELHEFIEQRKHIMVGKVNTEDEIKSDATDWMVSKENNSFDLWYPGKQLDGDRFYCSEIIWAGYLKEGVDIDPNPGFTWNWANSVSPQELFENPEIEIYNLRT